MRPRASHSPTRSEPCGQAVLQSIRRSRQSRGPWLARGLCCPSGSSLTTASSETLPCSCWLICFVQAGLCPSTSSGRAEQSFPTFLCVCVPACRLPYPGGLHDCWWLLLRHELWPSPNLQRLGIHNATIVGSHVACITRLQSSFHTTARTIACPSPTRTFTPELSPPGSPPRSVGYNYMGTQPTPMAGLTPATHAAPWAASRLTQIHTDLSGSNPPISICVNLRESVDAFPIKAKSLGGAVFQVFLGRRQDV